MSVTGTPGGPPVKVGVPICDLNAGMYAAYGILCAYINRLRTGEGQMVDTSLLEGGMAYTFWESVVYFSTGEVPGPLGSAHRLNAPYQAFRTKDGYMVLGAPTQPVWERFCRAIDREDLLAKPRFANAGQRKRHEKELADILAETFVEKSLDYWLELLDKSGTPAGPIYNLAQVYSDPQVLARDMLVELEDPHLGTLKNIGIPVKLSRTGGRIRHRAPALGEHTEETLLWAGFTQEEVSRLKEANLVA